MSIGKPARFVIFGAGAVGSVIGGLLARAGSRVVCVARPAYADALKRGIVIREGDEELTITADAVTSAGELDPSTDDVVMITTKSQNTESAVDELFKVYGANVPVVCLQNGARNEEIAARRFQTVYAGLVFISAVQLEPSVIAMPQGRTLAIGCYPSGLDESARSISDELTRAGFEAIPSAYVMAMKWGKLVANLNNATTAITGYFLEQASADSEMRTLMVEVREEGLRVLDAAGIAVEPPDGEPSPIRIRKWTAQLKQPRKHDYNPADFPSERRTYSSMWQDLFIGRKSGEAEFLNGEIVALGRKLGIRTPYNSTLLRTVNQMFDEGLKPGLHTPSELRALIRSQV